MNTKSIFQVLLVPILVAFLLTGCGQSDQGEIAGPPSAMNGDNNNQGATGADLPGLQIASLPLEVISAQERESLIHMREEEKLARDVYIMMYQRWNNRIFNTISRSEAVHMQAVLSLLTRYGIPDPVGNNGIGVFTDIHLQQLFDQLVARGSASLTEALRVGVAIEELDIADLTDALTYVDNRDIIRVYSNLRSASQAHLRAFTRNLP